MCIFPQYSEAECEALFKRLAEKLRVFMESTGHTRAVLGLSGGIDSAMVLALAVHTLGKEHIHAIFLPSEYTSQESYSIVAELANNFAIDIPTISIDSLIEEFSSIFVAGFGVALTGIALENIQARIRGNILMSYTNTFNTLLLATSNKSELSVGFCTLYGDTCGAIAPLGDIYKTHIYTLARYYTMRYNMKLPEALFTREPSAELGYNQKDTDRLLEYPLLDTILYALEHDSVENLKDLDIQRQDIDMVQKMKEASEFKRLQCPPSILV